MNKQGNQAHLSDIEFLAICRQIEALLNKADDLLLSARKAHLSDSAVDAVKAA